MTQRFFVTVIAPNQELLADLDRFGFALFQQSTQVTKQKQYTIEGVLTLEQIGQLVEYGCRVLVEEESSKRARAPREVIEFSEWLKGMEGKK
jgi:hypothetical protein